MRSLQFFIIFISVFITSSFTPDQKKVSLLIAEFDGNASVNHLQHLVKYVYVDGIINSREVITSLPTQKKDAKDDYVRFDIGKNRIYRNRYVISGIGNVIDIKTRKLLVEERGDFVAFNGDSIIFHTNDIFKGKYYSILNLKTEKYEKVENPNYNPLPRPDVEVDETVKPFNITAYYINGKKDVLVKDAGYGEAQPLIGDDVKRKFQIFWLDNSSFLYANFTKNQQSVTIYKVNLNKMVEKIATIDAVPATAENAHFEFAEDKSIIFSCGKGRFIIDLKKKQAIKLEYEAIGNNFFIQADENPQYGRIIKYGETEIGKKWARIDNNKTTEGYTAFQIDLVISKEHFPQGVAVWNATAKKWNTLDISFLADIIGWVEE
jgi:hypothetical protein